MDVASFRVIALRGSFRNHAIFENLLEQFEMLHKLTDETFNAFTDALVSRHFKAGVCIMKEGDMTDGMYYIEAGAVRVTITRKKQEVEVAKLGQGKYFGGKSLIENSRRTASVYAVTDVNVAFLDKK